MKMNWKRLWEYFLNWTADEYITPNVKEGEVWWIAYDGNILYKVEVIYVGELVITYKFADLNIAQGHRTRYKNTIKFVEKVK